ncbi:p115 like vesicle tethering protein [Piptocephalis cylindrospora]|uniref:General vesicular transport factor p115 n=1 Tax=Piptocephalis cylindrospora TaxID=1907219 RepID=A0A4P9Y4Y4_9FUNG|nr:p115 like vesicle tethering protein [Piptocephalis cylindrospora]|eukprot:RKP13963.1 p115 like vesicle tethering protein [Piptocephalis cylindrospora]
MDFFSRGYSNLVGSTATPTQDPTEIVLKLRSRLEHGTLLEDRRSAVLGLKGLSRQYKKEVAGSIPGLVAVLERDRSDVDVVKAAIETLNSLCTPENADRYAEPTDEDVSLAVANTDSLISTPNAIMSLLTGLEEFDFYVRFNTLQLLSTLLHHRLSPLQAAVLTSGMGCSRLVDLLDDRREAIRNESLLLLIQLTDAHAEIQKIIAFENAFERLTQVAKEEGGPLSGGIVVQDCLQLCMNLLRYNTSNQNYFRETGGIQSTAGLLEVPEPGEDWGTWPDQAATNVTMLLQVMRGLLEHDGTNTAANQAVMGQCVLPSALTLAVVSVDAPLLVRTEALLLVGDAVRKCPANVKFLESPIPAGPQKEVIPVEVACYMEDNSEGRLALLSSLSAPPTDYAEAMSAGAMLVSALTDSSSWASSPSKPFYASSLLSTAVRGFDEGKAKACDFYLGDVDEGEEPVPLIHAITLALGQSQRPEGSMGGAGQENVALASGEYMVARAQVGVLCFLCEWCHGSSSTVAQFLGESLSIQTLIEWIHLSSGINGDVQGLAAYLLALAYAFNEDPETPFDRISLQEIVRTRVGTDQVSSRISRLRDSPRFQRASSSRPRIGPTGSVGAGGEKSGEPEEMWYEPSFIALFKETFDEMTKLLSLDPSKVKSARSGGSSGGIDVEVHEAAMAAAQVREKEQDEEINRLKARIELLEEEAKQAKVEPPVTVTTTAEPSKDKVMLEEALLRTKELETELAESKKKFATLEGEQEDLLVFLAEQDTESKKMRSRLRELGEDIPPSDDEEEEEAE